MTGRIITAQEALDLGVIGELVERDQLLPRAWELARTLAALSSATLRGTRAALTLEWRRLLSEQLHTGLTHEALAGTFVGAFPVPDVPIRDLYLRS